MVTFIVPCYKLANYLIECVNSIISQSFKDIEILILDDQSPDDTAEISSSIVSTHPQHNISYILNNENLGNIRNYNKGIGMARGKYVWILSPDDRLRSENIVEKYVQLMESHPEVGYIFCPGFMIEGDQDMGLYSPSLYGKKDQILDGPQFAEDIVDNNFELLAPSVMIRKKCYEEITFFPEDMPHRGDSYVWALIAMQYKVGYFAEAMVDYRIHDKSMKSILAREKIASIIADEITVTWRIMAEAEKRNFYHIVGHCMEAIVQIYARALFGNQCRGNSFRLPLSKFETSLNKFQPDPIVRSSLRCKVLSAYGDRLYWGNRFSEAKDIYRMANAAYGNKMTRFRLTVLAKLILLQFGTAGGIIRHILDKGRKIAK